MAPSLRKMLRGTSLNAARPEEDADSPSQQRSTGDLKTRARQQQQREEENQRQFPKRNNLQSEDLTDQPIIIPGSVLQERYEVTASGKKISPYEKVKAPTSKFAVPRPTPPEPSSIYYHDPILDQYARGHSPIRHLTYPDCRPQVKVVQAQGCDFEMATDEPTGGGKQLISNPPNTDIASERGSRSSTRRQERADSHQDDVSIASARDFATTPRDGCLSVPSLNIRKHLETPTRIPSPRSSPRSPSENMPVPPAQAAENERKGAMEGPAYTTSREIIKDKHWDPPPSKAARTLGLQPMRDQRRASPSAARPPVLTPGAPDPIAGVVVRPPFYDSMKHASLQWASPGITNSRPAGPWEPCPRWTCCKCAAETIVEQTVCANLDCGHDRCPVRCQVRVAHRDRALFR